jgi:hypothetical protein
MPTSSVYTNKTAYEAMRSQNYPKVKITVEVALDMIPGWGDNIEDHINLIFGADRYIISAEVQ